MTVVDKTTTLSQMLAWSWSWEGNCAE